MRSVGSQKKGLRWVYEATHRTRMLNSTTTVRRMSVVVRRFFEFTELSELEGTTSLATTGSALVESIHQWELSLRQGYAATSNLAYKDSQQLSQILRWHIQSGRPVASLVRSRAEARPLAPPRKETPVDELPNRTRLELRDSCRAIIRQAESRIQRGTPMASNGAGAGGVPDSLPGLSGLYSTTPRATAPYRIGSGLPRMRYRISRTNGSRSPAQTTSSFR